MTRIRHKLLTKALLFALLLVAACRETAEVDRFVQIPDRSWTYDFQPAFELQVDDRNQAYQISVNFRHSEAYQYANVFLRLHQQSPDGNTETKRVELTLAEPDGRWTGKNSGNIYTHCYLVSENHVFPDTGLYKLSIEQNMRENPLKNVIAVGLRIEATE